MFGVLILNKHKLFQVETKLWKITGGKTMSDDEMKAFEIVFRGDIQFGQNLHDVKQKLQQLFKIDSAKVDALFSGKPVVLKRGLDKTSAEKYQDVLTKAGAMVEVVSAAPAEQSKESPKELPKEQPKVITAKPEVPRTITPVSEPVIAPAAQQGQWTLAPVGSLMMPASSRLAPVVRQFNLGVYSLRPVGGNLLDKTESRQIETAPLDIPDYKLAAVGTNLIDASEKMGLPILEIDVGDWGLSAPGAPLLTDKEKAPVVNTPVLDVDFSLAPVGSLLEQIKPQVEIKIPDVSGLKIIEN